MIKEKGKKFICGTLAILTMTLSTVCAVIPAYSETFDEDEIYAEDEQLVDEEEPEEIIPEEAADNEEQSFEGNEEANGEKLGTGFGGMLNADLDLFNFITVGLEGGALSVKQEALDKGETNIEDEV